MNSSQRPEMTATGGGARDVPKRGVTVLLAAGVIVIGGAALFFEVSRHGVKGGEKSEAGVMPGDASAGVSAAAGGTTRPTTPAPVSARGLAPEPIEGMVWVPAGEFSMGTDDADSMANERPSHRVRVDGFYMDKMDVTNAQFRKFVEATGYVTVAERTPDWEEIKKQVPPGTPKPDDSLMVPGSLVYTPPKHDVPLDDLAGWWTWTPGASWKHPDGPGSTIQGKDNYPVVQVSWEDASAYASWAGKQLPTEAQWEYAARGGLDKKRFAWGDEFMPGGKYMANTYQGKFPVKDTGEDGYVTVSPVGAFPANGYGLYDMAGNVWAWCRDFYQEDLHKAHEHSGCLVNPSGPAQTRDSGAARRVIKGGSFLCNVNYCESYRPSARRGTPSDTGSSHVGFRCVMTRRVEAGAAPTGG